MKQETELKPDIGQFINPRNHSDILAYFEVIKGYRGYIDFLDTGVDDRMTTATTVRSEQIYIPPKFSKKYIDPQLLPNEWPKSFDLDHLLSNAPIAFLIGDPGTGKTTFVNRISTLFGQVMDNAFNKKYGFLIPIPITLRDLDSLKIYSWETLINYIFSRPEFDKLKDNLSWFHQALETGQAFFLFDGLDEIGDDEFRDKFSTIVQDAFKQYPKCRWWFTTRPVGFDQFKFLFHSQSLTYKMALASDLIIDALDVLNQTHLIDVEKKILKESEFVRILHEHQAKTKYDYDWARENYLYPEYYFSPFDNHQIKRFAQLWFELHEPREFIRKQQTEAFIHALEQEPAIQHLARIPILLTMMALHYRVKRYFPDGRVTLYKSIAQAYLKEINEKRKIRIDRRLRLDEQMKCLGKLALFLQEIRNDTTSTFHLTIKQQVAEDIFFDTLKKNYKDSEIDLRNRIGDFFNSLKWRSEILIPKTSDTYSFLHLSYQEYFASESLREEYNYIMKFGKNEEKDLFWTRMRKFAQSIFWQEVMVLFFEGFRSDIENLIEDCIFCYSNIFEANPVLKGEEMLLATKILTNSYIGNNFPEISKLDFLTTKLSHCLKYRHRIDFSDSILSTIRNWGVQKGHFLEIQRESDYSKLNSSTLWVKINIDQLDCEMLLNAPNCLLIVARNTWTITKIHQIEGLKSLKHLDLSNGHTSQKTPLEDLLPFKNLTTLVSLTLAASRISNISPLEKLTQLEFLNLNSTKVSDLSPVSNLKKLKELYVSGSQVADLSPLAHLSELEILTIAGTKVVDLSPVQNLKKLRFISCKKTSITDLTPLSKLDNLVNIELSGSGVSYLPPLKAFKEMSRLDLSSTGISDLSHLDNSAKLEELIIDDTAVSSLEPLKNCINLTYLSLSNTSVTDLTPLSNLAKLRRLNLGKTLIYDLSALKELDLYSLNISQTSIIDITPLKNFENLKYLDISKTNISNLNALKKMRNLKSVNTIGSRVSDIEYNEFMSRDKVH